MVEAAVLVPLFRRDDGDLRLLLVRRAAHGRHGGQLAFPGGKRDPSDPSPLATMLRETREEIGLEPNDIEVLEHLPAVETTSSGFRIWPFLGRVRPPSCWRMQVSEIDEVLEVSVSSLVAADEGGSALAQGSAKIAREPGYAVGSYRLWGVSYRILQPLVPRVLAGTWHI